MSGPGVIACPGCGEDIAVPVEVGGVAGRPGGRMVELTPAQQVQALQLIGERAAEEGWNRLHILTALYVVSRPGPVSEAELAKALRVGEAKALRLLADLVHLGVVTMARVA